MELLKAAPVFLNNPVTPPKRMEITRIKAYKNTSEIVVRHKFYYSSPLLVNFAFTKNAPLVTIFALTGISFTNVIAV